MYVGITALAMGLGSPAIADTTDDPTKFSLEDVKYYNHITEKPVCLYDVKGNNEGYASVIKGMHLYFRVRVEDADMIKRATRNWLSFERSADYKIEDVIGGEGGITERSYVNNYSVTSQDYLNKNDYELTIVDGNGIKKKFVAKFTKTFLEENGELLQAIAPKEIKGKEKVYPDIVCHKNLQEAEEASRQNSGTI